MKGCAASPVRMGAIPGMATPSIVLAGPRFERGSASGALAESGAIPGMATPSMVCFLSTTPGSKGRAATGAGAGMAAGGVIGIPMTVGLWLATGGAGCAAEVGAP